MPAPTKWFRRGPRPDSRPVAPRHSRFHQHPPQRPPSDTAERNQPVARTGRPHFPVRSRNPRRPVRPRQPRRRRIGRPGHAKLAEHRTAPLTGRNDFDGGVLTRGSRAGDRTPPPPSSRPQRQPPPDGGAPTRRAAARDARQHQAGTPRRGPQQGRGQAVIIAGQSPRATSMRCGSTRSPRSGRWSRTLSQARRSRAAARPARSTSSLARAPAAPRRAAAARRAPSCAGVAGRDSRDHREREAELGDMRQEPRFRERE